MARPMSPLDSIFLAAEKPTNPMHIGGLHLFSPPADDRHTFDASSFDASSFDASSFDASSFDASSFDAGPGQRVAPYFSRRAVRSLANAGQWSWQDVEVTLEDHVHRHVLPAPGRVRDLLALCSDLHSQALDRTRPLWQAHLISGLADGRLAIYFKLHHALGDGMQAQRLLGSALSRDRVRRDCSAPWLNPTALTGSQSAATGLDGGALLGEAAGVLKAMGRTLNRGRRHESAAVSFAAPRSILNVGTISGDRRFAAQSWPLQRIRAVRTAAAVSTNDVVLAMCAGALRAYLNDLNALPEAPLIAMVPVALRSTGVLGASANAVGAVMCSLATDLADPVARLGHIHDSMQAGKAALAQMTPTQVLAVTALGMAPLLLEPLLGQLARSHPPFNLIISNVPGSRVPLYFNGAPLDGMYPLSIPLDGQALNITCTTYLQQLSFGLTGCRRTVPHLQRLLGYLGDELDSLEKAV